MKLMLREIRERQLLSQHDLAKVAGFDPSAISHFEIGRRTPTLGNAAKLADALGCSLDELVGREKPDHAVAERNRLARALRMVQQIADRAMSRSIIEENRT